LLGYVAENTALREQVSQLQGYLATFKKFFKWMGATGLVSPRIVADVLDTLKFDRENISERLLSNYHFVTLSVTIARCKRQDGVKTGQSSRYPFS
jgi:hypothetical protein